MSFLFPIRLLQLLGLLLEPTSPDINNLEGEIVDVIKPGQEWRIKFRASYWTARSKIPADFQQGDRVRVIGHKIIGGRTSNTLLIERIEGVEFI